MLGLVRGSLENKALPSASVVSWKVRDGLALSGYLTRPASAAEATLLPLIVYPHGGTERRDLLTFDLYVQYWASRGYAVFQPSFRGSEGFGEAFINSGHGEWGGRMQDDVTNGLKALIEQKIADTQIEYASSAPLTEGMLLWPAWLRRRNSTSAPSRSPAWPTSPSS
jgi:dipeptidyl aminopeptidase/acylaminoacyl peptidase